MRLDVKKMHFCNQKHNHHGGEEIYLELFWLLLTLDF